MQLRQGRKTIDDRRSTTFVDASSIVFRLSSWNRSAQWLDRRKGLRTIAQRQPTAQRAKGQSDQQVEDAKAEASHRPNKTDNRVERRRVDLRIGLPAQRFLKLLLEDWIIAHHTD